MTKGKFTKLKLILDSAECHMRELRLIIKDINQNEALDLTPAKLDIAVNLQVFGGECPFSFEATFMASSLDVRVYKV